MNNRGRQSRPPPEERDSTMKQFKIEYYGKGRIIKAAYVLAKNKTDALLKLRAKDETVLEILCIRNLDFED